MIIISYVLLGLLFLISIYLGFKNKEGFIPYFIIPIFLYIVCEPLLKAVYVDAYDTRNFLSIFNGMYENVISAKMQIPYRINYTILYGFQQPIFYHLTPCYLFVLLFSLGLSEIHSLNIMILVFHILTAIFMYLASYRIFKNKYVGIVSSVMLLCDLSRISIFYEHFRLGEIVAMVFVPLLILSSYEILYGERKRVWLFVLSASLIYQSHMLTTYLYFVVIIILFIVYCVKIRDLDRIRVFIFGGIITVLVNLWYLIPQIYEFLFVDFINPAFFNGEGHFSSAMTISSFVSNDYTKLMVICLFFIMIIGLLLLKLFKKKDYASIIVSDTDSHKIKIAIIFMTIGVIYLLLTFDFIPLDRLQDTVFAKFIQVLQFRTRLNLVSIPFISLGFPYIFKIIIDSILNRIGNNILKYKKIIYIVLTVIIASFSGLIFMNNYKKANKLVNKMMPGWNLDYFLNGISGGRDFDYNNDILLSSDDIQVYANKIYEDRTDISFDYYVEDYKGKSIILPLYCYPVYKVLDENNQIVETREGYNRMIEINLTKNSGSFRVCQYEPPLWLFGDIISLLTLISIIVYYVIAYRRKKNEKSIA